MARSEVLRSICWFVLATLVDIRSSQGDEHHDGTIFVDIDNDDDLDIISIGWGHKETLLYENLNGVKRRKD